MAHIHELATSRDVCDAYASAFPGVPLIEHTMDSKAQLDAILENRLDVAILRVTPSMITDHPRGWNHRLLRMEPMVVVGGLDDGRAGTVSLVDQPFEVFGDPVESGTYNAHGTYLTALEQDLDMTIKWLGTPGAFSHCLAHVRRADSQVGRLEFLSYGERYAAVGLPFRRPRECQPYYPWSLAWRDDDTTDATTDFLRVALQLSGDRGWLELSDHAPAWLPPDGPVRDEALARPARRRHTGVSDRGRDDFRPLGVTREIPVRVATMPEPLAAVVTRISPARVARSSSPGQSRSAMATAVATVACPQKATSATGLKYRTRIVVESIGTTQAVSE